MYGFTWTTCVAGAVTGGAGAITELRGAIQGVWVLLRGAMRAATRDRQGGRGLERFWRSDAAVVGREVRARGGLKLLLETGKVDVDSKDPYGQMPLWRAAENGQEAVVSETLTIVE